MGKVITITSNEEIKNHSVTITSEHNLSDYRFMIISTFVNYAFVNPVIIPVGFNQVQSRFYDNGIHRYVAMDQINVSANKIVLSTQNSGYWIG